MRGKNSGRYRIPTLPEMRRKDGAPSLVEIWTRDNSLWLLVLFAEFIQALEVFEGDGVAFDFSAGG